MQGMQRRQLLRRGGQAAAAAAGTAALSACTIRRAEETRASGLPQVRWRMATSWPISLDTIYGGAVTICQRVEEMSGGAFCIEPFTAGEIVPGLEVLDAVQARSVECGHTASYYYIGKNPAFAFRDSGAVWLVCPTAKHLVVLRRRQRGHERPVCRFRSDELPCWKHRRAAGGLV